MASDQSNNLFKYNFIFWKIFGIWGGKKPSKYYKYYSAIYLFVTLFCYNLLLTLNLIYTPPKIELIIREVIFYFTEITVAAKVFTILFLHSKLVSVLENIDSEEFLGDYNIKDGILQGVQTNYKLCWKLYASLSNSAYFFQILVPLLVDIIRGTEPELPICKYYFLSEETRRSYYIFWFIYQSFGMYGHMMYNVNIDSFVAGLLVLAISQLRLLNKELSDIKLTKEGKELSTKLRDQESKYKLNRCLIHYDAILRYYKNLQDLLSVLIFFQYSASSAIICVVLCGLLLPSSTETKVFLVMYFLTMTIQIFIPGFLGTQLFYESQELVFAAYDSDWIKMSESFKRSSWSQRLFMERAKRPIVISGLKLFPLSLVTFTSIMKTAYSLFTLIRNVQEK